MTAAETSVARASNRLLWRPENKRPHIESLFLKLNLPEQRRALWFQFGARTVHPTVGDPHAHVMAALFDVGRPANNAVLKKRFSAWECSRKDDRLALRFGDCVLEEGHTAGELGCCGRRIAWELRHTPAGGSLQHYCYDRLYELPFPRTKATTPVLDTRYSGWVELDGERIEIEDRPGMQGHNWGTEYAHRWAWAHANTLQGAQGRAVFEALTGQIKLGPVLSPWIGTAVLDYAGERWRFDTLRDPQALRSRPGTNAWRLEANGGGRRLDVHIEAPPADFIGVNYLNPDGRVVHCFNCSVATAELRLWRRRRLRWVEEDLLQSTHGAALELAGPAKPAGMRIFVP